MTGRFIFVCLLGIAVTGCTSDASISLTVKLRTDYQPLREFSAVKVTVDAEPRDLLAVVDGGYIRPGQSLATFSGLAPDDTRAVKVSLNRLGGNELISTRVLIDHQKDTVITVAITRDCGGMRCDEVDGVDQRCLQGQCVDARCIAGIEPFCKNAALKCDPALCASSSSCAIGTCESNICFEDTQNHTCPEGYTCDLMSGCVPDSVVGDCAVDSDCMRDDDSEGCISAYCIPELEICVYDFEADGQAPAGSACGQRGGLCDRGSCLAGQTCVNGVLDAGESDIDCGGGCAGCGLNKMCSNNADCQSGACDQLDSNTCEAANTCGNGVRDAGEACDDGAIVTGDGCDDNCLLELGQSCVDNNSCATGACDLLGSNSCEPANTCGNGNLDSGEGCDDGGTAQGDGCDAGCLIENGQSCSQSVACRSGLCTGTVCQATNVCGNNVVEAGEGCDDDNTLPGDGCDENCLIENGSACTGNAGCQSGVCDLLDSNQCEMANQCGNSTLDAGEGCDDGNTTGGDGCNASCKKEIGQSCTLDNQCASGVCDTLGSNQCEAANQCGNGTVEGSEACDDGGTSAGDGCDNLCKRELGETCSSTSQCTANTVCDTLGSNTCEAINQCGNGAREGAEACDDGNTNDGDGCASNCTWEPQPPGSACTTGAQCNTGVCLGTACFDPNVQYIKASNTEGGDLFGESVAVSGDTMVVGAYLEDSNETGTLGTGTDNSEDGAGAVYVYTRSGSLWSQQAYIKASNTESLDYFGTQVALSGDTLAVTAVFEDSNETGTAGTGANNLAADSGAVYIFTRSGSTWTQQAYIKASNTDANDRFGERIALDGDTLVVSAYLEDSDEAGTSGMGGNNLREDSGAVYVFTRSGVTWSQQAYLKPANPGAYDYFGRSVAISGNTIAVGAHKEDSSETGTSGTGSDDSAMDAGAVYVFTRSGTTWSQQAYIKASNTESDDQFGESVAVSGDTLAVSAALEDSNETGTGGTGGNNAAMNSGAVYVFTRSGVTWSQQAYLKASNTDAGDQFGFRISLDGDTLAVSAPNEQSNETGTGGTGANNAFTSAGAVYLFRRDGGNWTQVQYLKASNTGSGDNFGRALCVADNILAVSAYYEDSNETGTMGTGANNLASEAGAAYVWDTVP